MNRDNTYLDLSSKYILSSTEKKKLIELLLEDTSPQSTFLLSLIKEMHGDLGAVLRVINLGSKKDSKVIKGSVGRLLLRYIKDAIILANYKYFIEEDKSISTTRMAKTERFKLAELSRYTIIGTFNRHNIEYRRPSL